jgi:rubrerythrin
MSEQELIEAFVNDLQFDVSEYLDSELSENQKKLIEDATFILQDNIVGDVIKLGGNFQKNKEKFENFIKKAESVIEEEKYRDSEKELKQFLKDYAKKLQELIDKTCVAVIPVKELPWVDVIFRSIPRIMLDNKKAELLDNAIAYYGEIKCVISRTTVYGKIKDEKPLFAPLMGDLDLKGYKLDESQQDKQKSRVYPYISNLIESLDSSSTRSQLAKYHEGYQRHGEPICDFLMSKTELLEAMEKIRTGLDMGRIKSEISICGMAIPFPSDKTSLVLLVEERKDSKKYGNCFEAFLRFSAACCQAPSTGKATTGAQSGQVSQQRSDAIRTPGGQELKVWTVEELAEEASKRGGGIPPDMEVWSPEDLQKLAEERGSGLPEGMEVWTEEELTELAKKRQGGLDIPEWKPDDDMMECVKCGYSLRKGWSECPICETPVETQVSSESIPESESEPDEPDSKDQISEENTENE